MQNYLLDKKGEDEYITSVVEEDDKTLTITFADGRVFRNIKSCPENLEKIAEEQENQAIIGLNNYEKIKRKKELHSCLMIGSGIVCASMAGFLITHQTPAVLTTCIGAVSFMGMIPSGIKLCKDNQKLKEISVIQYISDHIETLGEYRDYPNALAGLKPDVAEWYIKEDNPFSILNLDLLSLEDLKTIMKNIKVEKDFTFTYKKTRKTNS